MSFTWKNNLACTSVYKTMERDDRMNQFEELVYPFELAKDIKIGDLKFFPNAASGDIKNRAAKHFGATFFKFIISNYVVRKEKREEHIQDIFNSFVEVLENESKTLFDLAKVVDEKLMYEDEINKEK